MLIRVHCIMEYMNKSRTNDAQFIMDRITSLLRFSKSSVLDGGIVPLDVIKVT